MKEGEKEEKEEKKGEKEELLLHTIIMLSLE